MFLLFHVFLSRLLYSAKTISAITDIFPVICLGSDVVLNKSKFILMAYVVGRSTGINYAAIEFFFYHEA